MSEQEQEVSEDVEAPAQAEGQQQAVPFMPLDLDYDMAFSLAWLRQMLGQILGELEWTIECNDPMSIIHAINDLRPQLEAAGMSVPAIVDPEADPLGNMMGWRDFLSRCVTVH